MPFSPHLSLLLSLDQRQDYTLRRGEARGHHHTLVLPRRTRQLAMLDRGLAALRFRLVGYPHIRVECPETSAENRNHERCSWRRQCCLLGR